MAIPTPPIDTGHNGLPVPPDGSSSATTRFGPGGQTSRRLVSVVAVLFGAVLVGLTLRLPRASAGFYAAGYTLAAVWIIASLTRRSGDRRSDSRIGLHVALGTAAGVVTFCGFVLAAEIGSRISLLAGPIDTLLGKADAGPVIAVLALSWANAVAEELFFRGTLFDAIGRRWAVTGSLVTYVAVTAVTGNTALVLAAVVMGAVFVAERVYTRGLAASITTHLVWSTLMILALPR